MSATEARPREVPAWLADMEFCHVTPWGSDDVLCGADVEGWCAGEYNGEAICPSCARPTCPRCAQLAALEDALEES